MRALEDQEYFAEREKEARRMAAAATDPSARAVHMRLAQHYARRARSEPSDTAANNNHSA